MPRIRIFFVSMMFVARFATPLAHAQALGCTPQSLQFAEQQLSKPLGYNSTSQFAQLTVPPANRWNAVTATDWTSGFFPGAGSGTCTSNSWIPSAFARAQARLPVSQERLRTLAAMISASGCQRRCKNTHNSG